MSVMPFPPRHAGAVLAQAMAAADAAAGAQADRQQSVSSLPWSVAPELLSEQAALTAAMPILRGLIADPAMVAIVAHGMATEALLRLRKRGAL